MFCKTEDGEPLVLDEWQAWLIDRLLERYPDDWPVEKLRGRLRYRQVVISMGRQNGKSELACVLGFYGLMMHEAGPYVVGLASNAEQARIIYDRVKKSIDASIQLSKRFKATGTRGITRLDKGGYYQTKPAKADALQGIPVTLCLFDEVHICDDAMWTAMVMGTQAKADGIVVGLTTAGDDTSVLLKSLYTQGREAAAGTGSERFGCFIWEAPIGAAVDDPEALLDANPAIASGRRDIDNVIDVIRGMPEDHARRYALNQFTSSQNTWLPMGMWTRAAAGAIPEGKTVFVIDRTPSWEHGTITAATKVDGIVHTEMVASFVKPNLEWLTNVCLKLSRHRPALFVMDRYQLGDLADALRKRGQPVRVFTQADVINSSSTAYALIAAGKVRHANDPLVNMQMPHAVKKNIGDTWRISRAASAISIDAVMCTVMGIYAAETLQEVGSQVF